MFNTGSEHSKRQPNTTIPEGTEVILHIGAPKTGSSALQRFLIEERPSLTRQGFYYPTHGLDRNGVSGGHSNITNALIDGQLDEANSVVQAHLKVAKSDGMILMLSAEGFYIFPHELAGILRNNRVLVVAFARHPLDAIHSRYNQAVKRHFGRQRLSDYCRQLLIRKDKDLNGLVLLDWRRLFGAQNVLIIPYGQKLGTESTERAFVANLGLDETDFKTDLHIKKITNGSYAPSALEFKRLLNSILDRTNSDVQENLDWLLQEYSDSCPEEWPGLRTLIGDELFKRLANSFEGDVKKLEKETGLILHQETSSSELKNEYLLPFTHSQSLGVVAHFIANREPFLAKKLKGMIDVALLSRNVNYNIIRLAEIFGCDLHGHSMTNIALFTPEDISIMLSERSEMPDLYRELAKMCMRNDNKKVALEFIRKAHELRPEGLGIIILKERLEKELG